MKRILSILMAAVLLVSAIPTAFAAEGEHDYSNGTQITLVGTQETQGASWTVTVPAKMQPGQTGTVKAEGMWNSDEFLVVGAASSVTLTYGAQSMDVAISWKDEEGNGNGPGFTLLGNSVEQVSRSVQVEVAEASRLFGTWEGILVYQVDLIQKGDANGDGVIDTSDKDLVTSYLTAPESLTDEQKANIERYCDFSNDGQIAPNDSSLLSLVLKGKINSFLLGSTQSD